MSSSSRVVLAVSGESGSFSEEAGLLYAQRMSLDVEIDFAVDMEGVLARVESGNVDMGIFPVVNSRGGLVRPAFDAMGRHSFVVVDELWLEVHQCLLVLSGVKKEEITNITSHSQAIAQCDRFIKQHFPEASLTEWEDTAKAAKDLAGGVLPRTTAVIAPARAAQLYGLELFAKGIQDNHPNLTTFIIVQKKILEPVKGT